MAADSAPASAVTAPPPGVGRLAAAASRNWPIVADWSYVMLDSGTRLPGACLQVGNNHTGWKPVLHNAVPHSLPAGVVLHAAGRQVHRRERFELPPAGLDLHLFRLRRADRHHAFRQPLARGLLDVLELHGPDFIGKLFVPV